jgi:hypothetical protein
MGWIEWPILRPMKHATTAALDRLEPLLAQVRHHAALKETARGTFYLRSRAVLHFHEDPAGLFADLRGAGEWERFPVNTAAEQGALLRALQQVLTP